MQANTLNERLIQNFKTELCENEKSPATVNKYMRDVRKFAKFVGAGLLNKQEAVAYKRWLMKEYAPRSVNSMLVPVNGFLQFIKRQDCCVKLIKIQRQMFVSENKELTAAEYQRLLKAAQGKRLELVLRTICETGIRVSELRYITVESLARGQAVVDCKNKTRVIFLPASLQKLLSQYVKRAGIKTGSIFVTREGKPLNRSNIWRDMKALCQKADVIQEKVFPHNLRHLFARTFYAIERDVVRLADLLGHSSINTTRIYTTETGKEHRCCLERTQKALTT